MVPIISIKFPLYRNPAVQTAQTAILSSIHSSHHPHHHSH